LRDPARRAVRLGEKWRAEHGDHKEHQKRGHADPAQCAARSASRCMQDIASPGKRQQVIPSFSRISGRSSVNQRLAPLQLHVANPASAQDRQRTRGRIRVEIATRACQLLVARGPAEVACGVAKVGYRYVTDRRQRIARLAANTVYVPQIAPGRLPWTCPASNLSGRHPSPR
jgi:hypothetical protein